MTPELWYGIPYQSPLFFIFVQSDILLLMHTRVVNDSKNEVDLDQLMKKFDKNNLF